ncbi:hypothetical protein PENSPDRAFT_671649 [Peniophora sp. CONT]|nr:hypothetical protein PENSPDRAFT_671649 [Peniophora sp. CONT]
MRDFGKLLQASHTTFRRVVHIDYSTESPKVTEECIAARSCPAKAEVRTEEKGHTLKGGRLQETVEDVVSKAVKESSDGKGRGDCHASWRSVSDTHDTKETTSVTHMSCFAVEAMKCFARAPGKCSRTFLQIEALRYALLQGLLFQRLASATGVRYNVW